ncbi:MAG TPA: class D sortase [Candidatus Sulfotelmatobacter sp.]|nr:class D sortase [Candidatus Sulfotelmatobacter sp.]
MTPGRIHFRSGLRWLEGALWIAGCCALGYWAFTAIDASLTQAKLARALKRSQIRVNATTPVAANPPTATPRSEHADKVPAQGGTSLARLKIPRVGLSVIVQEGVESQALRVGLGHVPGTSWPGQPGNVVIAGHRDTFFRPLRKIEKCDEIALDTAAHTYYYRVSSFEVVDPHDVNEMRFHGKNELTLITCYPFSYVGSAPQRFIVHAEPVIGPEKCPLS